MNILQEYWILTLVIIIVLLTAGAWIYHKISQLLSSSYMKKKRRQGAKGEAYAKKFLLKNHYKIIREQPGIQACLYIDGKKREYSIRADFLVEKDGESAVVEVKTGTTAIDPLYRYTRRQLLEYSVFYDVNKILFFNAETMELKEIEFKKLNIVSDRQNKIHFFTYFKLILAAFFIGGVSALLLIICFYEKFKKIIEFLNLHTGG